MNPHEMHQHPLSQPAPLLRLQTSFLLTMLSRLFISTFILTAGNCVAVAEPMNTQPLAIQEQIAALKKQNQEMHKQIETLKQQSGWASSSRHQGNSAALPVVVVTNGRDAKASVQSLKWAIEAMNGRR